MPIVFIHGVNTRRSDPDYAAGVDQIKDFLRGILAPELGWDGGKVQVFTPYWGDLGVRFRWQRASLPGSEEVEALALGSPDARLDLWLLAARREEQAPQVSLAQVSRDQSFERAVELVWDTAAAAMPQDKDGEIARGLRASMAYAAANPAPQWALQTPGLDNEKFLQRLRQEMDAFAPAADAQTLSVGGWWARLKEGVSRLGAKPGDAAGAAVVGVARAGANRAASQFIGDAFVYLDQRGTAAAPGPIVREVLKELRWAAEARQPGDDKLVVIGHSFGGVIFYDIVTTFAPDLRPDAFVSVGSQVGLFEEMTLYEASDEKLPPNPPEDKLPAPAALKKWLNIFDTNDIFSFRGATIFSGVTDYRYDTGYGVFSAHGGYFARPSFYRRLGIRLRELGL